MKVESTVVRSCLFDSSTNVSAMMFRRYIMPNKTLSSFVERILPATHFGRTLNSCQRSYDRAC